jgi:hypothetical protein
MEWGGPVSMKVTPLPDMSRLLSVWEGAEKSATSLEHATQVFLATWTIRLAGLDIPSADGRQEHNLVGDAADLDRTIARVIDDEVTWQLGNRPETVLLVDDDFPEIVTVGELVGRIAMLVVVLDKWPPGLGDCPTAPAFAEFGRRYDSLTMGLVAGSRRQPRRRSHGAPPIPQPRRIDLAAVPRN